MGDPSGQGFLAGKGNLAGCKDWLGGQGLLAAHGGLQLKRLAAKGLLKEKDFLATQGSPVARDSWLQGCS
ncbi:hypothetical protein BHE74_00015884 [Ensete ventricosum]|nr:hypothetical protein GW17_00042288 [Ensete ventricosum]RWW76055.1 hypothetical protein BHE74_00015884 [Ensete ventricosum]RZR90916.1 hypothetical protein BHM03_00018922 [Ensete ventricosum]